MQVAATGSSKAAVTGAIRTAAQATGTSFNYLLATAKVESNLNPNLTMRSSTATGLFQFLEQTWLGTLKQAGPAHGYGSYAGAISQTRSGRYEVSDPALRQEIMQLRKDPTANAVMGAAFTQQNAAVMTQRIGRTPSDGELYIGHFFGPYAGSKAINLAASNPSANAAEVFPAAAQSNRPIFYDKAGTPRSIAGVCAELVRRYQVARASASQTPVETAAPQPLRPIANDAVVATAPATPVATARAVTLASAPARINDLLFSPAPMPTMPAFASEQPPAPATETRPGTRGETFRSLFQTAERREAVSPVVAALWSTARPEDGAQAAERHLPAGEQRAPVRRSTLDLFRDTDPNARSLPSGGT
jgi:hypothetical protein